MQALALVTMATGSVPLPPQYYTDQIVDHFAAPTTPQRTWTQRYYMLDSHFKGPGSPIICIVGGEGGIAPSTGIFYPWVANVLGSEFGALVIEPEHRFYGESMPMTVGDDNGELGLLTPMQALADTAEFIRHHQKLRNCTARGTPGYCPVITFGGSYPGFLSAMMRLRYPAVVDMAYAASAPVRFYAQQVAQFAYYEVVTKSAERAVPGCPASVRAVLATANELSMLDTVEKLGICPELPAYIVDVTTLRDALNMVVMYSFADLNMKNYPPTTSTGLAKACTDLVAKGTGDLDKLKAFLAGYAGLELDRGLPSAPGTCFNLSLQLPAGKAATISSSDWSGVGTGSDGRSWDFETCTFLVEQIGTNGITDMFPPRNWTFDWLGEHCQRRFGVSPQPHELDGLWGFGDIARTGITNIIFTNGLNDGWSVGGVTQDLAPTLLALNMPHGAHHSDLSHNAPGPTDTPDVTAARAKAASILAQWLKDIKAPSHPGVPLV